MDHDIEQNIRTRAYLLWEIEGRQDGNGDEYLAPGLRAHQLGSPVGISPDAIPWAQEVTKCLSGDN